MVNYNNSSIYKLVCRDHEIVDCYVGSTTNFKARKRGHRCAVTNENSVKFNYRVYKFIRENGGWRAWAMVLIEPYNAEDKQELRKREAYWVEKLHATLNCQIPGRTSRQYAKDHAEYYAKYKHTWYILNRGRILNNQKRHRDQIPDEIAKRNKLYYEKNKHLRQKRATCSCGVTVRADSLSRHKKTHNLI